MSNLDEFVESRIHHVLGYCFAIIYKYLKPKLKTFVKRKRLLFTTPSNLRNEFWKLSLCFLLFRCMLLWQFSVLV